MCVLRYTIFSSGPLQRICHINLFKNNHFIIQNFNITICFTLNNHYRARWLFTAGRTGQANAMVNRSLVKQ